MIVAIRCNMPHFRKVEFSEGFNVILADRTMESTRLDSRNGLGKTTLIDIIHFCLGAQARRNQGLLVAPLEGWYFTLEMVIGDRELVVTRGTDDPGQIHLDGDLKDFPGSQGHQSGGITLRAAHWNSALAELLFGFRSEASNRKYQPSFRSLFSYAVRRRRDSFASPFVHHRAQREWDKQVNNAYLLGMSWEHASQFQELKDEGNLLNSLRRAAQEGLLEGMVGSLGNLEAERARLETHIRRSSQVLQTFRVHPQYREIEQEANRLTSEIQHLLNDNLADGRLIELYLDSLESDQGPEAEDVLEVYELVGVTMPELVRRRLEEVQDFHLQLLINRRDYLQSEIQRIESNRGERERQIQAKTEERAQLLEILQTHGALQEYTHLQELHLRSVARRNDIEGRITNLRRFEQGRSEVRVKRELLLQTALRAFEERREAREEAINTFNANSEALYSAPGNLVVDVAETGFKFDVEILRSGSHGIDNMKVFCYDLMLAQLWATKQPRPRMLIHDSTIFDGVDERQTARALEMAQREADRWGFQYICALNSDTLPYDDFSPGFDLDQFVKLRLTDESVEGGLLGIRY